MSRATNDDTKRWLALFLRNACAPRWSIKTLATSSPSIMTIEKRLRMDEAHLDRSEIALALRDINHKHMMLKVGLRLGLGSREIMV